MKTAKLNRHKSKEPRKGWFWCLSCDRSIVHPGEKCKVCGNLAPPERFKKPIPPFDLVPSGKNSYLKNEKTLQVQELR